MFSLTILHKDLCYHVLLQEAFLASVSIAAATTLTSPIKAGQHTSVKISFQDSDYKIIYNFEITLCTTFEYTEIEGIEQNNSKEGGRQRAAAELALRARSAR